jgi:hypothetical protein
MKRFYAAITTLIVVWSVSMGFFALAAWDDDWTWAIVGVVALVVFAGLGGLLMPPARTKAAAEDERGTFWLTQFFGASVTTEFLLAAQLAWVAGNRTHHAGNAYQTLGLVIFLALLGVGQGVPATFVFFLAKRSHPDNPAPSRDELAPALH